MKKVNKVVLIMCINLIKEKYPDIDVVLSYTCAEYGEKKYGIIILNKIVIPKEKRKTGIGTDVMNTLCEYADKTNSVLMLSPSTSLGATSINRLKTFYKRFGLKNNSGRNKIFQFPNYSMYRFNK